MILVTGATGFLGSELILQLTSQGKKLRALKRQHAVIPKHLADNELIEWFIADINDPADLEDAFSGIKQVFHCAALVSFLPSDQAEMLRVNIEGTSNIANLCQLYGVRLVHVSSVAALGEPKKNALITEKDFWEYDKHSGHYAISKYEGEMEVWRSITEGLDAVIVNPSVIIGPSAGFQGSGSIFKLVRKGMNFYTSGGVGIVDVSDVAAVMIKLMDSEVTAERFIISSENYTYRKLFKEIAEAFGLKAPQKEAKPWMLGLARRIAGVASAITGKSFGLTKDVVRSSMISSFYDNEKVTLATGIRFKPVGQSIKEVCLKLKNH
ncbi:NAD-dependent epimerase/dehydratase family protein [Pedobacter antarcticus]|uniref:NAD-dependent epimerase/dehydratase family protein n=1 Tax=Pedobacter antarcticus TaxID=34086 RepID=UPI00087E6CFC|nr:NAD-dependent epimerase/dehydratase family protein [Pedobacter antarcticus]SDL97510.1 Nucleoside-diphosphate-sugar epimerase [Pedobacter antarcticus]